MKYYIKTKHGISEAYYRATNSYWLFGTGQGSGASPAVWLTISVILLSALTALASVSMKFMDPWYDIFDEQNADGYVDDSANGARDSHQEEAMMLANGDTETSPAQCTDMGATVIQLGRCSESQEVFLVSGILGVERWSTRDGNFNLNQGDDSPHVRRSATV